MTNFDSLTEPSKLNVRPKRIKVQAVQRSGTLSDAFKYFGVRQKQFDEIALLNNMELSDRVQKGKLIKILGN
jgi:predicted Zn-dependent protease